MKSITLHSRLLSRFIFPAAILTTSLAFGGAQGSGSGWSTNPFDEKEFIENKGQFITQAYNGLNEPILFAAKQNGVNIYFTAQGVSWRHDEVSMEEEKEITPKPGKKPAEEEGLEVKTNFVHMHWDNANPNEKVIADEPLSYYRT